MMLRQVSTIESDSIGEKAISERRMVTPEGLHEVNPGLQQTTSEARRLHVRGYARRDTATPEGLYLVTRDSSLD